MNAPFKPEATTNAHPYSRTCNCDECFETWLAMPEPSLAEKQRMAREFSKALFPAGKGELVTDWPKVSFPDLDRLSDEQLQAHSKDQRKWARDNGRGS